MVRITVYYVEKNSRLIKTALVILLFISVTLFSFSCSKSQLSSEEQELAVTKVIDISYSEEDTLARHKLDVYYKKNTNANKVILFVPGGAWKQGDKDSYVSLATTFSDLYNYTVVVMNYRLSDPEEGAAVHPDHIKDIAMAFQWVKEEIAEYNGNREAIFLFGQSAGAHLVALLASDDHYLQEVGYSPEDISGVISMSGAYSLDDLVAFPFNPLNLTAEEVLMYKALVLNAFGSYDSTVVIPASPYHHINESMPPFLIISTEVDMPGFAQDAENYYSEINSHDLNDVSIKKLYQTDYSEETWQTATELAAAEPAMAEYIGHYAEVVAINEIDHLSAPTSWIVHFVESH